jgi:hypothetical protein
MRSTRVVVPLILLSVSVGLGKHGGSDDDDGNETSTGSGELGSGSAEIEEINNSGLLITGIISGAFFVAMLYAACATRRKVVPLSQQQDPVSPLSEAKASFVTAMTSYGMPMIPLKVLTREP